MQIVKNSTFKDATALTAIVFAVLIIFFDVLFKGGTNVVSSPLTDIATQFVYFREFGFGELKKGNLALWNPYLFSGTPFLGGFQSALLYPLNLVFLILPVNQAINTSVVLHVILIGVFMYLWVRGNGLGHLPAFLSAVVLMFSGAHFPHIYAGHLSNLCTMAWVPLLFLCFDRILGQFQLKWVLAGIAAFAMQILAGHPQYVYYSLIVSALYVVFKVLFSSLEKGTLRCLIAIFSMFIGSALLSAVQILTGIEASGESVRAGGVPYGFAALFSLPPENIMTLIVPNVFGDLLSNPYWGRTYYWESNLYVGIGGFTLAVYALIKGGRKEHLFGILILICLVLALGARTPIFDILFNYFPGYNQFRGTAKFIFFAALFFSYLAGSGLNLLIQNPAGKTEKKGVFLLLLCALILSFMAIILYLASSRVLLDKFWEEVLHFIGNSKETYIPQEFYRQSWFFTKTAFFASLQFLSGALIFLSNAVAWNVYVRRRGTGVYVILFLAILDVLVFAGMTVTSFDVRQSFPEGLVRFYNQIAGEKRVLNLWRPNMALSTRVGDIWGYDPGVTKRYAEFIAFTQGENPDNASQYVNFNRYHPLLRLTRLGYVILPAGGGLKVHEFTDEMPHATLVYEWICIQKKEEILKEMSKEDFNVLRTVVVEKEPPIERQVCRLPGVVSIEVLDTDTMVLDVKTFCPGIVLITDSYSKGWKARSLTLHKNHYEIMPADYAFMAIPVDAGHHRICLEYLPEGFVIGTWISLTAVVCYAALWGWCLTKHYLVKKRRKA